MSRNCCEELTAAQVFAAIVESVPNEEWEKISEDLSTNWRDLVSAVRSFAEYQKTDGIALEKLKENFAIEISSD